MVMIKTIICMVPVDFDVAEIRRIMALTDMSTKGGLQTSFLGESDIEST